MSGKGRKRWRSAEMGNADGNTKDPVSKDFCSGGVWGACVTEGVQEQGKASAWGGVTDVQGKKVQGLRDVSSGCSQSPSQALPMALRPDFSLQMFLPLTSIFLPRVHNCYPFLLFIWERWHLCISVTLWELGSGRAGLLLGKCHWASLRSGAYQAEKGHAAATEPARSLSLDAGGICGCLVGKASISGLQKMRRTLLGPRELFMPSTNSHICVWSM